MAVNNIIRKKFPQLGSRDNSRMAVLSQTNSFDNRKKSDIKNSRVGMIAI